MARLFLSLLGPLDTRLDGEPVIFATDKAHALLVYLAVESDHPHRRDALAGLLWPDQPQRKARQNLRQALAYIHKVLGAHSPSLLLVTRETMQFNPNSDYVLDVAQFDALYAACRNHRHRRLETCRPCLHRLEALVALYRGEFLEHFFLADSEAFEEWALFKREWYHLHLIEALALLARYEERRGNVARAREYTQCQVVLEPWREEAHRTLMRLLAAEGQRSAALMQYEKCRRILTEELGVEPTAETTALYAQIRAGHISGALLGADGPGKLHNLPRAPTSFVGRDAALRELAETVAAVLPDVAKAALAACSAFRASSSPWVIFVASKSSVALWTIGSFKISAPSISFTGSSSVEQFVTQLALAPISASSTIELLCGSVIVDWVIGLEQGKPLIFVSNP